LRLFKEGANIKLLSLVKAAAGGVVGDLHANAGKGSG
tara:strand:- start:5486 stop:5596 length:111 start_codon:yes stop_codon:yes gene_type:complete